MVAYLGKTERPLSSLVLDPQHSLLVQSYAPKEMMSGVVNADGFGVGWYAPEVDGEPAVYRSNAPIWADRSFASIAPRVRSSTIFAAVRSATPGLPVEELRGREQDLEVGAAAMDGEREDLPVHARRINVELRLFP